jgi:hypothetical protein
VRCVFGQLTLHPVCCSVGIATDYGLDGAGIESRWGEIFRTCPDRPCGPPNLLYNWYRVFPGGKVRPGRAADHSPPSSAEVMEEYSYTSTHPLGHTGPVTGLLYLYLLYVLRAPVFNVEFISSVIFQHKLL